MPSGKGGQQRQLAHLVKKFLCIEILITTLRGHGYLAKINLYR